jgi:hypothetical protein
MGRIEAHRFAQSAADEHNPPVHVARRRAFARRATADKSPPTRARYIRASRPCQMRVTTISPFQPIPRGGRAGGAKSNDDLANFGIAGRHAQIRKFSRSIAVKMAAIARFAAPGLA